MEKFYEKKNFGIPVTILNILAYLIGYSLTRTLSGSLLVAVLFAGVVFTLQFDDRVKNAVKHSYIFATYFILIDFVFDIFASLGSFFSNGKLPSLSTFQGITYGFGIISRVLTIIYTYALIILDLAVLVIFGLFILMALLNKDLNLFCVKKVLGEAPPKPKHQPPVNPQQPQPPYGQQSVNQQQPQPQQPTPAPVPQVPVQQQPIQQQPAPAPVPQAPVPQQSVQQQPAPAPVPQAPVQQPPAPAPVQQAPGACTNCGHVNVSGAKFCASCGTKLQ